MSFPPNSDDSSSSSVISDLDFDENLTEEEAMAIWERRNIELEEQRLERERAAAARAAEAAAARAAAPQYPQNPDSARAYQRYLDVMENARSGRADGYVASTPGLATLLEMQRQQEAAQRREDAVVDRVQREWIQREEEHMRMLQRRREEDQLRTMQLELEQQQHFDPLAEQAREYERLAEAHRRRLAEEEQAHCNISVRHDADMSSAEERGEEERGEKKKKPSAVSESVYYLGLPNRTQWNTKQVVCQHCNSDLYTHPLARQFCCQSCCKKSNLEDLAPDFGQQRGDDSRWEEKMQDMEDEDMAY